MPHCYGSATGEQCPFAVAGDADLLTLEDRTYCRFHAPMDAQSQNGTKKSQWTEREISQFNSEIFEFLKRAAQHKKSANLNNVVFPGDINLRKAGIVDLHSISLDNSTFNGRLECSNATFTGSIYSISSTFYDVVNFSGCKFEMDVMFSRSTFMSGAVFFNAKFKESAVFSDVKFRGGVYFSVDSSENYMSNSDFSGSMFVDRDLGASFSNREFRQAADFTGSFFFKAPDFHGSKLHQGTDFSEVQWLDRRGGAAPAYRTLKLAMESIRARDEEAMFNALELECRRHRADTPRMVRLFSLLYSWASDYGLSLSRPVAWLVGLTAFFFYGYLLGGAPRSPTAPTYSIDVQGDVLRFTLAQIVRPFQALASGYRIEYLFAPDFERPGLVLGFFATLQSVISLGLIALFLLTLRWRFKRD